MRSDSGNPTLSRKGLLPPSPLLIALSALVAVTLLSLLNTRSGLAQSEGEAQLSDAALGLDTTSDLLGWWRLDDVTATGAPDSSGNGFMGLVAGGTTSSPVPLGTGQALYFDGGDDLIEVPGMAEQLNGAQALTVALWIRSDLVGTDRGFISGGPQDWSDNTVSFRYDEEGQYGGATNVLKAGVGNWRRGVESIGDVHETEWQHVAMTWLRGEPVKIWLNGQLLPNTATGDPWNKPLEGLTTFLIGQGHKYAENWQGWLRDVRVYRRSLSGDDIASLASSDWLNVPPSGEGIEMVSGDRQGPEDGQYTERPLLVRVLDQNGRPVEGEVVTWSTGSGPLLSTDGVSSGSTVDAYTDQNGLASVWVRQPVGNQEPFSVQAETVWAQNPVLFTVRPWGLIGRWRFDEVDGQIIRDSSGNGMDGVLQGGATIEQVPVGSGHGMSLDGVDDWMEAPGIASQLNGKWAMTLSIWVKSAVIDTNRGFITDEPPYNGDHKGLSFRYDKKGWNGGALSTLKGAVRTTWGSAAQVESASNIQATEWQNFTFVWRTKGELEVYLNGARLPDSYQRMIRGEIQVGGNIADIDSFFVGRGARVDEPWQGWIGEVRLYDRALTGTELTNTTQTNPEDLDGDGLPDWWEDSVIGTRVQVAADDHDFDGETNGEEYQNGLQAGSGGSSEIVMHPWLFTAREPAAGSGEPATWPPSNAAAVVLERRGDATDSTYVLIPHRGSARIFVTRDENGNAQHEGDFSVAVNSGSAMLTRWGITAHFLPGQRWMQVVLIPTDDGIAEGTEELLLQVFGLSHYTVGADSAEVFLDFEDNNRSVTTDSNNNNLPDVWEQLVFETATGSPNTDNDGDSLTNREEYESGTVPEFFGADTDWDGLQDKWEVDWGTDPLRRDADADPDQDSLTNTQERGRGTDPLHDDTDGDTLKDGWEDQYQLDPLSAQGEDGKDGDPDGDNLTNELEQLAGTHPQNSDSDSDGMGDGYEVNNGLNALVVDSSGDLDGDGLTNQQEHDLGTSANSTDSDGDGMPDGYESENGLDPTIDDSAGDADGDGTSNGDEHANGTDPNDPASGGGDPGDGGGLDPEGDADGDGVKNGEDGWPLNPHLAPRPVVVPNYAVIPLTDGVLADSSDREEIAAIGEGGHVVLKRTINGSTTWSVWSPAAGLQEIQVPQGYQIDAVGDVNADGKYAGTCTNLDADRFIAELSG